MLAKETQHLHVQAPMPVEASKGDEKDDRQQVEAPLPVDATKKDEKNDKSKEFTPLVLDKLGVNSDMSHEPYCL
ncbi:hypothetical protein ACOSQ2_020910 [Xanthoceras sorbifolium]